ncbi:hypothetical protein G7066_08375 [Leucobacter coleopterorum]|uniref:EamA domain-containing protein n=1 Tax=Leucobacter coleopterorum TaxID=2714933 RepID=A0ABX6JXF2_9MICO|nr:hypothetical protein [Leucobacter coleopterorum]QIM18631.1 hypothetical protein G7066_08375 [Leucobacter coleopterorum]
MCVIRLGPKDLLIESVLVPLIFGAWAMLALVARVRAKLVWKTAAVVGAVLGVFMLLKVLIDGSPFYFAPAFWESLASFLLLGLVALFLVLVTASALGRTGFATVGTYYAAPWAISMLAGFVCFNLNLSRAEFTIMAAILILASAVILTLSRYVDHRVIRATDQ